jgi:hypothetical protein
MRFTTLVIMLLAVPLGAAARAADVVSVRDFGAVGNGVTDDTAALQAAITHAQANGGSLFIPPGRYHTVSPLMISQAIDIAGAKRTWLNGATYQGTTIVYAGTGSAIILDSGAPFIYRVAMRHMTIAGEGARAIIYGKGLQESEFVDLQLMGSDVNPAANGFLFDGLSITNIDNCVIQYVRTAISLPWSAGGISSGAVNITRSNIFWVETAIRAAAVDYLNIVGNWFEVFQTGILIDNTTGAGMGAYVMNTNIRDNWFVQSGSAVYGSAITEARAIKVVSTDSSKSIQVCLNIEGNTAAMHNGTAAQPRYALEFNTTGNAGPSFFVRANIANNRLWGVGVAGIAGDDSRQSLLVVRNDSRLAWMGAPQVTHVGTASYANPIYADQVGIVTSPTGNDLILKNTLGKSLRFQESDGYSAVVLQDNQPSEFNRNIRINNLPSSSPGAGTKQLWYDPADGNRLKFAP